MPPILFARRPLVEELEPRLLFSADFAPGIVDALAPQTEQRVIGANGEFEFADTADSQQLAQHARLEVVFIDLRVQDYDKILADIQAQNTDGHSIEVVLIDPERDGIAQIGDFLSQRQGVDAIHLISHGSAGSVQLGAGELNFDSLLANASTIKHWGSALSAEADILIYGCDLASTEAGQSLINALGKLTGADVAASDDKTGTTELGGDWVLEYHTGVIQAEVIVSDYGKQNWGGVLATFIVTNTLDTGAGSLREAINNANANGVGLDLINFNISGTGIHTINLGSALSIQGAVTINATTDDSYAANGNRPAIVINGNNTVQDGFQLYTNSSGTTIRGFVIQNFTQDGIDISGSNGNTIAGNWIGLNSAGTGTAGNQQGINLWNSNNNIIGGSTASDRNVISANSGPGISINTNNGTSTGNQIRGNYIGTNAAGTAAVGNGNQGIYVNAANNVIGGAVSGYGNVISGTINWAGIGLDTQASGTLVAGNLIGLNATGTAALGNNGGGITVLSANNTIGGVTAETRNVISGNNSRGLYIYGATATGNVVIGNYIGTNAAGTGDVNGTSQVNGNSGVVIDGGASINRIGTNADGSNDAAERNLISGNNWYGVEMIGASTTGNVVQGNYIGTDVTGLAALGNSNGGVSFWGGSNNTLGSGLAGAGNVISGNDTGVLVASAASNNKVQGNIIGLGADGSTLVGNTGDGVYFYNGGSASATTGNLIGTDANGSNDAGERNIISGNYSGVAMENAEVTGNTVAGNYIGTDITGTLDRGNTHSGIYVESSGNTFGGDTAAERNLVSGNNGYGFYVAGSNTVITGNWIGLDSTGNVGMGNTWNGVYLGGGTNNRVGGSATGEGNVISGHGDIAVRVEGGSGHVIQGNLIGTNYDGSSVLGNLVGFSARFGATDILFGGTAATAGNVVTGNGYGVIVDDATTTDIAILGNRIYSSTNLGIDLGITGVTANDPAVNLDADSGPNNLQNFPVLYEAIINGTTLTLTGQINSAANTTYRIEFFSNPLGTEDASGYGEGRVYLGFATVTTNASGTGTINTTLTGVSVSANDRISSTATVDLGGGNYGSTSEFSQNVIASTPNQAPSGTNGTITATEDTVYTFTVADFGFSDADSDNLLRVWFDTLPGSGTLKWNGTAFAAGNWIDAADIAAGLVTYTPAANVNGGAVTSFTFRVQDDGGTANGGVDTDPSANTLSINISAVNDAPVNTLTGSGAVIPEDTTVQLLDAVVISDVDGGAGSYTVTLSGTPAAGTLSAASGGGVTVSGSGTSSLVLTGTLASINAYFAAPATAPYFVPVADYNGPVSVTVVTSDNGNTGSGGALTDSDTSNGTISAVADIANDSVMTNEDTPVTFSPLSNDSFENAGRAITHIDGNSISVGGTVAVTGGSVTLNAGGTLTYAPTANYSGTPGFTYTVTSGGTTETATVSVTVNAVNDAPVAADDQLAIAFDGTDDYVSIADSASLRMSSTMTMEAWINPDVSSNASQLILNKEGEYEMALFPDGSLHFAFAEGGTWAWHDTGAVVARNTWTHVAIVYDAGVVASYVNGTLVNTQTLATATIDDVYAGMNELRIGGRTNNPAGQYFDGQITDVRVWDVARTQVEIAAAMNAQLTGSEAGLAGNWTFDENTGATLADKSANANHGTLVNGAAWAGYRMLEDGSLNVAAPGVLHNDYDADGDTLTAVRVSDPAHGTLVFNADGSFTYTPDADYFGDDSFTYKANDGLLDSNIATVKIRIDPVNDAPTTTPVTLAPIAEDSGTRSITQAELLSNATDKEGSVLTASSLAISSGSGTLIDNGGGIWTYTPAADDDSSVSFSYIISDGSLTVAGSATLDITPVNDAPVITSNGGGNNAAISLAENTSTVTTVTRTDVDGAAPVYSISGVDAALFSINSSTGELTFAAAPNFESPLDSDGDNVYEVTVQVSDGAGGTDTQALFVTVTDVDEFDIGAITDTDAAADAVAENAANGSAVGITAFASDADATNNAITYSLDDNAGGRFAIDGSTGVVTVADGSLLDRESAASHGIVVRATSADGSSIAQAYTIAISDVNEFNISAVSDANAAANAVDENAVIGTVVGVTAFASDADATTNTVTYSLTDNDGGRFAIDSTTGVVTVAGAIDRETDGASRNITVRATSADGSFAEQAFGIGINDVDEFDVTPVVDSNAVANAVTENAVIGTVVGVTAFASDADATANTVTYSLTDNDGGRFAIDSTTGVVTVAGAIDRETDGASRNITVRATSADASFTEQVFGIAITDADEFDITPIMDSDAAVDTVDENAANGTVVGITAFASDADATTNAITYSLDDTAGGRFAIDSTTGVVTVDAALDYESAASHSIVIRATSADGSFATQGFTISVTDANESGITGIGDTDAGADFVLENAANGTAVGLIAFADDADGSDSVSYSLDDDAGGRFAIDGSTGVVTVAGGIDREAAGTYSITVRATSTDTSTTTQTFTIAIGDVDEFDVTPVTDMDAAANQINENAAVGTVVGITVFALDADATTNGIAYSLTDNDGGRFAIDSATGVITVAGAIDREADGALRNVAVRATSADGSFTEQVFDIAIADVNEFGVAPVADSNAALNAVNENAAIGTVVGVTAFASDADATNNAITYSLDDNAGGRFTIDATTGVVTVADGSLLDYEAATSHAITLRATGSDGSTTTLTLSISVTPVNDNAPAITSDGGGATTAINVAENTATVTTVTATDADLPAQTLTYAIIGGADAGLFSIDSSTGALNFNASPDFEAPADFGLDNVYEVIVQVSDGTFNDTQTVSVTVTPVNDNAPVSPPVTLAPIAEDSGARLITQAELLASASDADGDSLAATGLAISSGSGTLTNNGDGTWTYTPALNDDTVVSFSYTVTDGSLTTAGSATLDITPVNDVPTVAPVDLGNLNEDSPLLITQATLLAGAADVDGDTLTAINLTLASGSGVLTDHGDGTWTFTPAANWNGAVSFSFDVLDGTVTIANSASLVVDAVNDAPVISANTLNLLEGETVVLSSANLNSTDSEQSPSQLNYTVSNVTHGQFEWAAMPGAAIAGFTQADIDAGLVVFVHDASDFAPAYDVSLSDGALATGPQAATINFIPIDEGINVSAASGPSTTEAGGSVSFDVALNSQPFADVTIFIVSGNPAEGTASLSNLTFTAANWSIAQPVTVTGVNDAIDDGDQAYTIQLQAAVSADRNYDALDAGDVALTNLDDDTAGIVVTPTSGLITDESGVSDTFSVVLTSQPLADVVISLNSSNPAEGVLSASSLTFTAGDWNIPRIVTVSGVNDTLNDGGVAYQAIATPAASADLLYNGMAAGAVDITNLDVADPVLIDPPVDPGPEPDPVTPPVDAAPAPASPENPSARASDPTGSDSRLLAMPTFGADANRVDVIETAQSSRLKASAPLLANNESVQREVLTNPQTEGSILLRLLDIIQANYAMGDSGDNTITSAIHVSITQDESFQVEILSQGAQITAVSLSVGAVWWALRAGGLFASLLTSLPAWRSFDMLPVLSRDEDEDDDAWELGDEPEEADTQAGKKTEALPV